MLSRQITPEYVEALCRMLDAALVAAISNYTAKNTEDGDDPSESEPDLSLAQSRIRAGMPILAAIARSWHTPDQLFHVLTTPRVAGGAPDVIGLTECRRAVAIIGSTAQSRRVAIEMAIESPDPAPARPTPLAPDFETATSNLWIALEDVWAAAMSDTAYTDSFGNMIEYLFWHLRNFYSALHGGDRQIPRSVFSMDLALARLDVPTIRALHRTAHDLVRRLRDDQIDPHCSSAFYDLSIAGLWPQVRKTVLYLEPDLMKVANMIDEASGPLLDIEAA